MVDHDVKRIVARPHAICEAWYENRPTKFAKALEMSYENLRQYLTGKSIPGNRMQAQLRRIGVDPAWVLYGTGEAPVKGHPDLSVALTTPGAIKRRRHSGFGTPYRPVHPCSQKPSIFTSRGRWKIFRLWITSSLR